MQQLMVLTEERVVLPPEYSCRNQTPSSSSGLLICASAGCGLRWLWAAESQGSLDADLACHAFGRGPDSPPTSGPRSEQLCRRGTISGATAQRLRVIAFRDRCEHVGDEEDPIVAAVIARRSIPSVSPDKERVAAWVGRNRHGLDVGARRDGSSHARRLGCARRRSLRYACAATRPARFLHRP